MKKRFFKLMSMLAVILAAGIVYYFVPDWLKLKCVFHEITGLYCPGCGMTRFCTHLIRLEFRQAFYSNCAAFICAPVFVVTFGMREYGYVKTGVPLYNTPVKVMMYFMVGVFIVFGFLRNIPFFSFLQPR